ncbi:hypothetical protein [Vibrio phage RYC]|nr:hypothetical protein [Vibrio phage RYC]
MHTLQTLKNEFGFNHILEAALWAEDTGEGDQDFSDLTIHDFSLEALETLSNKYNIFLDTAITILPPDFIPDWKSFGHDFWLTCQGHGTGFWDRKELEYQNLGNQLTAVCADIYLGDLYQQNGKVFLC